MTTQKQQRDREAWEPVNRELRNIAMAVLPEAPCIVTSVEDMTRVLHHISGQVRDLYERVYALEADLRQRNEDIAAVRRVFGIGGTA